MLRRSAEATFTGARATTGAGGTWAFTATATEALSHAGHALSEFVPGDLPVTVLVHAAKGLIQESGSAFGTAFWAFAFRAAHTFSRGAITFWAGATFWSSFGRAAETTFTAFGAAHAFGTATTSGGTHPFGDLADLHLIDEAIRIGINAAKGFFLFCRACLDEFFFADLTVAIGVGAFEHITGITAFGCAAWWAWAFAFLAEARGGHESAAAEGDEEEFGSDFHSGELDVLVGRCWRLECRLPYDGKCNRESGDWLRSNPKNHGWATELMSLVRINAKRESHGVKPGRAADSTVRTCQEWRLTRRSGTGRVRAFQMKTTLQAAVAATLVVAAPLYSQTPDPAAPAGEPATAAAPGPVPMDKVSYFIGTNIGGQMKSQGIEIDVAALTAGIGDTLAGKEPKYSKDELMAAMQAFEAKMQADAAKKSEAAKADGDKFLAENKKREGVTTTASGLQYEIIKKADGPKPAATEQVKVHYHGTLIDGKVFDSSVERGEPVTFPVQGVIKGWVEALQLMPVGSKWKLFIPSDLAYGKQGAGGDIGPDAALVFEVELLEIVK